MKVLCKLIVSLWVCIAMPKLPKITGFAIIQEEVNDEVDFLRADERENSIQIDTVIFDRDAQAFPKFPK